MLNTLRKNTKLIVWMIILSFCLWGAFSVGIQFSERGQTAGKVFGHDVSYQEFNKFVTASQIFSLTGDRIEDTGILHQHAWQNIIFAREARRQRIQVTDDEVRDEIKRLLNAQDIPVDSGFYENWVRSMTNGASPRDFEEMVREMLRIQKLLRQVRAEEVSSPSDAELLQNFLLEKRKLTGNLLRFKTMDEASAARTQVLQQSDWQAYADGENRPAYEEFKSKSLKDLMLAYGLTEPQITGLYTMESGKVSEPIPSAGGMAYLFRITEKVSVEETDFTAPGIAEKYKDEWLERKRYDSFLDWHIELIKRARFEDFTVHAAR